MVSVELRRAEFDETVQVLEGLSGELDKMAAEHLQRSQTDYLRHEINERDGLYASTSVDAAILRG